MPKIKTVLLIDDDQINNYLNERLLKKLSVAEEIKVTLNGKEGLQFLETCAKEKDCPEVIFLDINMPVMDGFEFLEAVGCKYLTPKTKIFILTTSRNLHDIEKIKNLGSYKVLSKPLTAEKVLNCICLK